MAMESVAGILERTKILRTKEERIATLETENAILHIKIAQLQSSFKKLLSTSYERQINNERCDRCKKCEYYQEKVSELHNQMKLLKKSLSQLQSQYSSCEQQLGSDLHTLSYIIPEVIQKSKQTSAETSALHTKYLREKARRKELHNALVELRGNIRVHCRIRPVLGFDNTRTTENITCVDDEMLTVVDVRHSSISGPKISEKTFEFERVHDPCDSQLEVFSQVKPLITSLLDGYNVCVMAYGQTGSGKSYTMLGEESSDKESRSGVVPLAGEELFRLLKEKELDSMYNVGVTVAEVYNEQIHDLLSHRQDSTKHDVIMGPGGSMEVTNLTFKHVETSSELIAAIHQGIKRRASDHTLIHDHSSRSHLIVTIHVRSASWSSDSMSVASSSSSIALNTTITPVGSRESTPMVSPVSSPRPKQNLLHSSSQTTVSSSAPNLSVPPLYFTQSSSTASLRGSQSSLISQRDFHVKLQLVDLAGSECVGTSGVSGESLKEAQYINRSLSSLSDVLNALAEKRSHIPYRNSVLTHLLQDTIGGDAKMVLMLCVSPTSQCLAESVRVLRFGTRARQVQRASITHFSKKKRNRDSNKSHH